MASSQLLTPSSLSSTLFDVGYVATTLDNDSKFAGEISNKHELDNSSATVDGSLSTPEVITASVVMSACIAATIVGNVLVILSVFTYRPLRGVQNFYIVSLAVADLAVAVLVMPFHVAYFVMRGRWAFGVIFCHIWLTADILTCTASILNLCAIALDRYRAIHDPIGYAQRRTVGRVLLSVGAVWTASALISVPPLIGWNRGAHSLYDPVTARCQLTDDPGFVVYSASGSFYIPLALMTFVYVKIFRATRRRLRSRARTSASSAMSAVTSFPAVCASNGRTSSPGGCIERSAVYAEAVPTTQISPRAIDAETNECSASSMDDDEVNTADELSGDPDVVNLVQSTEQVTARCSANTLSVPTDGRVTEVQSRSAVSMMGGRRSQEVKRTSSKSKLTEYCCDETVASSASHPADQQPLDIDKSTGRWDKPNRTESSNNQRESNVQITDVEGRRKYGRQRTNFQQAPPIKIDQPTLITAACTRQTRSPTDDNNKEIKVNLRNNYKPVLSRVLSQLLPASAATVGNGFQRTMAELQRTPSSRNSIQLDASSAVSHTAAGSIGTATAMVSRIAAEKQRQSAAKERRVARTMAVIMAAFVVCWLPFFVMYVLFPFCNWCADSVDQRVISFIVWLGYVNSTLNPVIYTVFNIDFRRAFKSLLTPRRR